MIKDLNSVRRNSTVEGRKDAMSRPRHLQFLQLLRLVLKLAAAAASAAAPGEAAAPTVVSPKCQAQCGNVSIPYPFGIGPGCHLEGFDIRCNTTFNPPRPFIGDTGAELIDFSLHPAEARVYKHIDLICYNQTSMVDYENDAVNLTTRPVYRFSDTRNKFTGVGCMTAAYVGGDTDNLYVSGCITVCQSLGTAVNGTCAGLGCCQTTLPRGLRSVVTDFDLGAINNTRVWEFNPCSYAFVVEEDWYDFTSSDLVAGHLNSTYPRGVPAVLDWAVRNQTCKEARGGSTTSSYACVDKNSECFDSGNGPGYVCNCSRGYEGNPYLQNGCRDINECNLPLKYPCYGDCINTRGNYSCSCPRGKEGDPYTENGCRSSGGSFSLALKVLTATMSSVLFLTVLSFGTYFGLQKRKLVHLKQKFFEHNGGLILQQQINASQAASFKLFTQEELERSTNKFNDKLIIGRGGHGTVYKGTLEDQRVVAIKKSKMMDEGQTKEFAKEMLILSQINHKNIIKILGCCLEVEVPMLVYEFIPNGTLFEYLHDEISIPLKARLRIAEESAWALAYLHSAASPPIIHGDVKSSNILLDEQFSAKVSDFGASKMAPKDEAQLATVVQGTCGYLDPEYLVTCQLTEKSDVYSFGVVIAELLTRTRPFMSFAADDEKNLASVFLAAMKQDRLGDLLDSELRVEEDLVLIKEVAGVAVQCLNFTGDERPTMKEVAESLEKLIKHKQNNNGHELLPKNYERYSPGPRPRSTSTTGSFDTQNASKINTVMGGR